jgi:hypothetical protein
MSKKPEKKKPASTPTTGKAPQKKRATRKKQPAPKGDPPKDMASPKGVVPPAPDDATPKPAPIATSTLDGDESPATESQETEVVDDLPERVSQFRCRLKKCAVKSVEVWIEAGQILKEAKKDLGRGNFLAALKAGNLIYDERTAQHLMKAVKGLQALNPSKYSDLPGAMRTVIELERLGTDGLERLIDEGRVTPATTIKEAKLLVQNNGNLEGGPGQGEEKPKSEASHPIEGEALLEDRASTATESQGEGDEQTGQADNPSDAEIGENATVADGENDQADAAQLSDPPRDDVVAQPGKMETEPEGEPVAQTDDPGAHIDAIKRYAQALPDEMSSCKELRYLQRRMKELVGYLEKKEKAVPNLVKMKKPAEREAA